MTSLFGGETNYLTMIVALAIVLALIVLAVWLLKLLSQTTQSLGRGRQKRLSIVDSVPIDQKRQAVIVRRDNVEHLIVIGGANDLVVETGFEAPPAPVAPARPARRMPASTPGDASIPRIDNATGQPSPKSLRHTGLLRATDTPAVELPGGKPERGPARASDSDTSEKSSRLEPELKPFAEAVDGDTVDTGTDRRK